jgi:hypothetical protein
MLLLWLCFAPFLVLDGIIRYSCKRQLLFSSFLDAGGKDGLFFAKKLVQRMGDVSDGGVDAHGVGVLDVMGDEAAGLIDVDGVTGRMQSALNDLCQRSILPLDWG